MILQSIRIQSKLKRKRIARTVLIKRNSYFKVSLKTPMAIAIAGGADSGKVKGKRNFNSIMKRLTL